MSTEDKFNVVQFFEDGSYEYVRRVVSAEEAVKAAGHYATSVAVRMGMVKRVIVTDMMDCICFEWQHDVGIVFPKKETTDAPE